MLLSEMFGVERYVDFEVVGYIGRFIIKERFDGTERLWWRRLKDTNVYVNADLDVVYDIIHKAPSGITHLPPPLTDDQREQLKALYTLEYGWLSKDRDGSVYLSKTKPYKVDYADNWVGIFGVPYPCYSEFSARLASLVSWSDPEPFDIAKALGVTG